MNTNKLRLAVSAGMAAVHAYLKRPSKGEQTNLYKRRRPLNAPEQVLYWRLIKLLPDDVVLAQVKMSRCIGVKGPPFGLLSRESLDFVICNKAMRIIAAIELQDQDIRSPRRQNINRIKEEALQSAGIKLIKWPISPLPSEAYIVMEFNSNSLDITRLAA
jgi:hypothetical protein